MATRGAPCDCFGLFDVNELEPFEPRRCLHCGKPTPPGKWRCAGCQTEHGAGKDPGPAIMREQRRLNSAAAER